MNESIHQEGKKTIVLAYSFDLKVNSNNRVL